MPLAWFHDWIRRIYATQDEELDCDQVFCLLARYVDVEVEGGRARTLLPGVEHHLRQCSSCFDLYLGVRDAAALESQAVPTPEVLLTSC